MSTKFFNIYTTINFENNRLYKPKLFPNPSSDSISVSNLKTAQDYNIIDILFLAMNIASMILLIDYY